MTSIRNLYIACGIIAFSVPAYASSFPAFSVDYAETSFLTTPLFTLGYKFSTSTALRVDKLGVFDLGGDGLSDSHTVGLFSSAGLLLASATIASGKGAQLVGDFRYNDVASVNLAAHEDYYLGALYASNADDYVDQPKAVTSTSGLIYRYGTFGGQDDGSAVLTAPLTASVDRFDGSTIDYFGPNMMVSAVPLPASVALFGLGLVSLGVIRFRRASELS